MKKIIELFDNAIEKNVSRNHEILYIAVDVHGTFLRPTKRTVFLKGQFGGPGTEVQCEYPEAGSDGGNVPRFENEFTFYPYAKEVLVKMSNCPWVKLILWTSTRELDKLEYRLDNEGIDFDYTLENPDFKGTQYANFDYKFFFDIMLEDKAGFDPEKDWEILNNYFDFEASSMRECKVNRDKMPNVEGAKILAEMSSLKDKDLSIAKDPFISPEMVAALAMLGLKYYSDLQSQISGE